MKTDLTQGLCFHFFNYAVIQRQVTRNHRLAISRYVSIPLSNRAVNASPGEPAAKIADQKADQERQNINTDLLEPEATARIVVDRLPPILERDHDRRGYKQDRKGNHRPHVKAVLHHVEQKAADLPSKIEGRGDHGQIPCHAAVVLLVGPVGHDGALEFIVQIPPKLLAPSVEEQGKDQARHDEEGQGRGIPKKREKKRHDRQTSGNPY